MIDRSRILPNICICFHCILHEMDQEPKVHPELFIPPGAVEALFSSLQDEGYHFALPDEAAKKSGPVCSVTFDDGYYNNHHFLETAEKYDIPFILFLSSYNVVNQVPFIWDIWEATRAERWPVSSVNYRMLYESLRPDDRALLNNDAHRPFTLEELETFAAHPLVRLAPHGHTHQPMVGRYGVPMDREIEENIAFLSNFPKVLKDNFALPCGLSTAGVRRRLLRRFKRIYTIDGAAFGPGDRVVHRISLVNSEFGGDLKEQIRRAFKLKNHMVRKAMTIRYSNRFLCKW